MNDNKITCDVCRDLLPLVKDGVASADSEAAVREHVGGCEECAMLFDGKFVPAAEPSESPKALLRFKHRLSGIYTALMLLGLYVGLSLTSGAEMFYNCLIMPVAGVFGYMAFRWRAVYILPIVLIIVSVITNTLGFFNFDDAGVLDIIMTLILWIIIYTLFALAGIIIAMLLHFAFGKVKKEGSAENER